MSDANSKLTIKNVFTLAWKVMICVCTSLGFKNEEELLSYLNLRYQQAVEHKSVSLITHVQDLLSVVETFINSNISTEVSKTCTN